MNRNMTTGRRLTGSAFAAFGDPDRTSGQIDWTASRKPYGVKTISQVVAIASLAVFLGAGAGTAYAKFNVPTDAPPTPLGVQISSTPLA